MGSAEGRGPHPCRFPSPGPCAWPGLPPTPPPPARHDAPPSCRPGSVPAAPAHRTAWPGPPPRSCRSRRRCQRPPWPAGTGAWAASPCSSPRPPSQALATPAHHASAVGRGDGPLKAVGAVDDDEASLCRCPQLLQQAGLGGPVPGAEGLQDHALQRRLQEGPDLRGDVRACASCSSDGPSGLVPTPPHPGAPPHEDTLSPFRC